MDPAQGETQGKSMTSKLKAKVKGVKGKVHLPGHKKRQGGGGGGEDAQGGDSSSGSSSDDSPKKPGPETGYNVGGSTPFTTVRTIPLSPAREAEKKQSSSYEEPPRSLDTHSTTESMAKMGLDENMSRPREGVLGKVKDTVGGAAAAVGNTMGYYTEVDRTPVQPAPPSDPNAPTMVEKVKHSLGLDKPADPNAPTMVEKAKHTLGLDKPADPYAPTTMEKAKHTLGLDKPTDPYAPTMMEKTKHTLGLDKPTDPYAPTMMEKAKATLGLDKPADPNAPTTMEKAKATLGMGASPGAHPAGTADMQSTYPAQTDYVPSVPHQSYGDRIGEERTTVMPTGGYNQGGYNQEGYNQAGYNQEGHNQGGHNQGGYNQGGYNQGGYNQGGYNQGGYNQGGYNQGGYNQTRNQY